MPKIQKQFQLKSYKVKNNNLASVLFDGTNDYITIPHNGAFNTAAASTVEAWIKVNNYTGFNMIITKTVGNGSTNNAFELRTEQTTGRLQFLWYDTALRTLTTGNAVGLNTWVHVAATRGGGFAKVYINGNLEISGFAGNSTTNTSAIFLGSRNDLANWMNGRIDEVRLWNVERTQAEIQASYAKRALNNSFGLVGDWRLDTGSGTTAFDSSTTAVNGTLTNGASWSADIQPIYSKTFAGYFPVYEFSSFSSTINSGLSDATLKLPKKFDNYGKGVEVDYNNELQVFVFDKENPEGKKIYTGYMLGDTATVSDLESVEIKVAGYISKLTRDYVKNASNQFKFTYTSAEHGQQIKNILNDYRRNNPGVDLTYTSTSIVNTGLPARTLAVSTTQYLDAINAVAKMAGANFYYFIDADNIFNFKQISTTPDHYFTFEKDIAEIKIERSIANTFNELLFASGTTGYSNRDTTSQIEYGRLVDVKQDSRYSDANSINTYISSYLEVNKNPFVSLDLTVIDSNYNIKGYDIESIQVGQTFKLRNYNGNDDIDGLHIITHLTYNDTSISIRSQDVSEYLEREIFNLANSQEQINLGDGPVTY